MSRWSKELSGLAQKLRFNNVGVIACIIGDAKENDIREQSGIKVIPIATDADLTEVL